MDEKTLQVEYWRAEFEAHRKRLGKNWRSLLYTKEIEFNNDQGRRMIESVSDGRANILRTAKVVEAMKKIGVKETNLQNQ